MARIITLGCQVADVHHRYEKVHSMLFGMSSYRLLLSSLTGRVRLEYAGHIETLNGLQDELEELEGEVLDAQREERSTRAPVQLRGALLAYIKALHKVISLLAGICRHLQDDEQAYRQLDQNGQSAFNSDKVSYDFALRDLELLGTKMNRLFATY
jgi:hypothetical protein